MSVVPPSSFYSFIEKQKKLIKLDFDEEYESHSKTLAENTLEDLEKNYKALHGLVVNPKHLISSKKLGRQIIVHLMIDPKRDDSIELENFKLQNGEWGITIGNNPKKKVNLGDLICTGYIKKVLENGFAFSSENAMVAMFCVPERRFNLIKIVSDKLYKRKNKTLEDLPSFYSTNQTISLSFGTKSIASPMKLLSDYQYLLKNAIGNPIGLVWFNKNLHETQKQIIEFALKQKHLAIINGPPGTGKTTVLVELILQMITRGLRLLVCAPSNVAVDNILRKLIDSYQKNLNIKFNLEKNGIGYSFKRIGVESKVRDDLKKYTLNQPGEIIQLENVNVIMSTLESAHRYGQLRYLRELSFDVVIIDECAQALEASSWIPLVYAKKSILAGDHQQLPATVFSKQAEAEGLDISLFERLMNRFDDCKDQVSRMLTVQYRMNKLIMQWPSDYFYEGRLRAAEKVADHRLVLKKSSNEFPVLRFIDTADCSMKELKNDLNPSKCNKHEAKIVLIILKHLIENKIEPYDIGVITPYSMQTCLIEDGCKEIFGKIIAQQIEIDSVDGFQGREKEVIILSMVRSNDQGAIGFLKEARRLNVAITRARKHLTMVGDSSTITKNCDSLEKFVKFIREHGTYEKASIYSEQMNSLKDFKPDLVDRMKCLFCQCTSHGSSRCKKSYEERVQSLIRQNKCTRCLQNHLSENCKRNVICFSCKGNHVKLVCDRMRHPPKTETITIPKPSSIPMNGLEEQLRQLSLQFENDHQADSTEKITMGAKNYDFNEELFWKRIESKKEKPKLKNESWSCRIL